MDFLAVVRSERATVAGMRAALDGKLTALDLVIASYESMPSPSSASEGEVTHDHPQMLDARVLVASPAEPVRTETAKPGHSGANGSAGEAIPASSQSGSPAANPAPPPAPTQVTSPATPPAEESAAGTNSDPGSPGANPPLVAPTQDVSHPRPAKPAVVERAAGTTSKPTNKAFGDALAAARTDPVKAKPVTTALPTGRDPLLARDMEYVAAGKTLSADEHHGSLAQQLADRILADMPALMKDHPRGPIRADIADRYGVKPARVQDAVLHLFAKKRIRLERFDGTEQHIVPPDFELVPIATASTKPAASTPATLSVSEANERRVMEALVNLSNADGVVEISQAQLAARAGAPNGSMPFLIGSLVNAKRIAVMRPGKTSAPAVYRVLSPTP